MQIIKLPKKLNREYFYYNIIPKVYSRIAENDYEFCFDMTNSELSNAEFLVGFLSTASLIRNKYGFIPNLQLPSSSSRLFDYLENINFFSVASIPNNNIFDFIKYSTPTSKEFKGYSSKISCIIKTSEISTHQNNATKITYNFLQKLLMEEKKAEQWNFYKLFELSLIQLIENFFEHNIYENTYDCSAYYLAQKMPYNVIQIVFYDTGKGFRKRIIEIITKEKESIKKGNPPTPGFDVYLNIEKDLNNKALIWDKTKKNPNILAIQAALDFRKNSQVPGLAVIKDFALSKGGSFFVHSANASIEFDKHENENIKVYNENFSGVHFCIEIPLK
jgi:hypothetical protein